MSARTTALIAALLLSGCATLEKHPVLTAVGVSLVAGSIAASLPSHRDGVRPTDIETPTVNCTVTSCR